jgi:hypothetical protein
VDSGRTAIARPVTPLLALERPEQRRGREVRHGLGRADARVEQAHQREAEEPGEEPEEQAG